MFVCLSIRRASSEDRLSSLINYAGPAGWTVFVLCFRACTCYLCVLEPVPVVFFPVSLSADLCAVYSSGHVRPTMIYGRAISADRLPDCSVHRRQRRAVYMHSRCVCRRDVLPDPTYETNVPAIVRL